MQKPIESHPVKTEVQGVNCCGAYTVADGIVTVFSPYGKRSTQVGSGRADFIARLMLRELAEGR
jgi:hypothetical protein